MTKTDGFVRLPNWLIDDSDLTLHELAVYIVLLRHRDPKTGKCFPGMTTIADRARVSRETVKRTIPKLEAKGMIRASRKKIDGRNLVNEYDVAVANETPEFLWANTKRGQRIPKRSPRHSEALVAEKGSGGRHSETLPRHSETQGVGAPSASKKIQEKKIQEQASTRTLPSARDNEDRFTFDGQEDRATEPQVAYLKDLATHLSYGSQGGTPDELQLQRWRKLTRTEAHDQIRGYLNALGRPDEIYYPQHGTPEYDALSEAGKEFADTAGMPDSVFDYGFKLKENRPA